MEKPDVNTTVHMQDTQNKEVAEVLQACWLSGAAGFVSGWQVMFSVQAGLVSTIPCGSLWDFCHIAHVVTGVVHTSGLPGLVFMLSSTPDHCAAV